MLETNEYISRDALYAEVKRNVEAYWTVAGGGYFEAEDVLPEIENFPAADVAPVRHGTWEPLTETQESKRNAFAMYRCSVCGKKSLQHRMGDRFCSQCGAEMEQSPGFRYCPFYGNAEWVHSEGGEAHCSECGCTVYGAELSPYCPQCGANHERRAQTGRFECG